MKIYTDIGNIQNEYLRILESHFQVIWQKYSESDLSPLQFLNNTPMGSYSSELVIPYKGSQWSALAYEADQLLNKITSFWTIHRQSVESILKSSNRLNTQIGDLNGMSSYYANAVTRLGLYFDSICLIDPLAVAAQRRDTMERYFNGTIDDPQLLHLILNYLEIRSLKPFLVSETDLPIGILIPPIGVVWGDATFKFLEEAAEKNTYKLFADAFNKQVDSFGDLVKIFETNSLKHIEKKFKEHTALNGLLKIFGSLDNLVEFSSAETPNPNRFYSKLPRRMKNMTHIKGTIEGIFLAQEGAETSAAELGIDINIHKHHWEFNKQRIKGNSSLLSSLGVRDEIPIQAAIMSDKMNWMSATTIDDLVKLRENGYMEQVREIYRINRRELQRASVENADSIASLVVNNVTEALQNYQNEIETLKQKSSKGWINKITLFFIPGSLAVASIFFPPLGVIGTAYGFLGPGASVTDLVAKFKDDKKNINTISNHPIYHMLEIWERGKN
jgi:hypothetical protein